MNQKLRELLMKEHCGIKFALKGIGDEPNEEMAKAALTHKHTPADYSKCQDDMHAPSKIGSKTFFPFIPCCMLHITDHENEG